ncbi:dipicolinic acid synthetase, B subunit [Desulfofarcimen acetoxidans DSM 771]|jgi:dipicolinate synthase subunit B|uniref:Dipicolinic acid synthetase, B subunit n=1 Tax=Desulfofarcimen acetoxidans (strain ATCC 49208 / DSM 771 / KCTC 5769 / VKM B-1644 / 5575) TaxID=485916 RepID=C8W4M3_DESAS|nr:dipicolinate synthase subunit B [Desulfofarcimen acetoxidans]ACV63909.1 dipicolinic acid synthetase, B subunit [Desulfofarcimen acetoxidans DSM 771]
MRLKDIKVGVALTGSHCCLSEVMPYIKALVNEGAQVIPIISSVVAETDSRFGLAESWKKQLTEITGSGIIQTITAAEPVGPQKLLDILVVAPCTGNTLAKLANAITDGPVLMAVKAHLRNQRPVVLGISTNDGLSMNAKNWGLLLNTKNIYVIPFGQDDPVNKPNSLKARWELIVDTVAMALNGKQIQPMLVVYG